MKPHPIIIVEGPDATGKSTWAREYLTKYGGRSLHLTLRKDMLAHQVMSLHVAARWAKECPVIIDRHWPSEQIYAGVYRGGSTLMDEARYVDRVCQTLGVFYVVALMGSPERMVSAHAEAELERPEMYANDERLLEVSRGYLDWWRGSKTCRHSIGHCSTMTMQDRAMAAFRYNRDIDGVDPDMLASHLLSVDSLSRAWRKHCQEEWGPVHRRLVEDRDFLAGECGYRVEVAR